MDDIILKLYIKNYWVPVWFREDISKLIWTFDIDWDDKNKVRESLKKCFIEWEEYRVSDYLPEYLFNDYLKTRLKTEHKYLLKILRKIKSQLPFNVLFSKDLNIFVKDLGQLDNWETSYSVVDVREIIFQKEFKTTFENYYYWENNWTLYKFDNVLEHLENPVKYLYKLLN